MLAPSCYYGWLSVIALLHQHRALLGFRVRIVYLVLNTERCCDGHHHAAVGADVVKAEAAVLAVFEPFFADLVATDTIILNVGWDGAGILCLVDVVKPGFLRSVCLLKGGAGWSPPSTALSPRPAPYVGVGREFNGV